MAENHYHTDADTIDYDFENDSLYLFVKGANYLHSVNLDNIILDEEAALRQMELADEDVIETEVKFTGDNKEAN